MVRVDELVEETGLPDPRCPGPRPPAVAGLGPLQGVD